MTTRTAPPELRRVTTLLLVNLGLSALLAVAFLVFHRSLLDYQVAHMNLAPGTDVDAVRDGLSASLWSRVGGVVVIGLVYTVLLRRVRAGQRRAFFRILILSVVSLAGIAYLLSTGQYPVWVDVEQGIQAAVLLGLLWAVTRPAVRAHFRPASAAPAP
jgi:bacteriorhodopsin